MMTTVLAMAAALNLAAFGGVQTGNLLGFAGASFDALYEIDIDTGEATEIHLFDVDISGGDLTVSPDGALYASFTGALDSLAIVDPETGELTFIGPIGFSLVAALAFAPDGTLYGFDSSTKQLLTIDPLTGQGTPVGSVADVSGTAMAFTPDGTLYLVGGSQSLLYTVDTETGDVSVVGAFGSGFEFSSGLHAIGEVLYASAQWPEGPPYSLLLTLNRETGEATLVGAFCPDKECPFMSGLAFLPGPGDADGDGDVDHDDFDIFVSCFTGPDPPEELPVGCLFLDSDHDGDIDCDDWEVFIDAWTEDEDPPSFPPCEPCEGDANEDGMVDPLDSGFVLARFGCAVGVGNPGCDSADQNGDGVVDPLDAGFVLARFGTCD